MRETTVVPRRTSYTPLRAHVGEPGLFSPRGIHVDVSVVFTWDLEEGKRLVEAWRAWGCEVALGGPALDDPGGEFEPGRFVRDGVVFTSRGCPNSCPWCYIPRREGSLRELQIKPGNEIQDNNFLACSRDHRSRVYQMLRGQRRVRFIGGLQPERLSAWDLEQMRGLRIDELWLAADRASAMEEATSAIRRCTRAGFSRHKVRCYVLCGFAGETMDQAESRCRSIYEAGAFPFAQPWDGLEDMKPWKKWAAGWCRPAATAFLMARERPKA